MLKAILIASASVLKELKRLQKVYHFIEANYQNEIDVNNIAKLCNLTTAAFCGYFKKSTHYTFSRFFKPVLDKSIKKIVLQYKNVTEKAGHQTGSCFEIKLSIQLCQLMYITQVF